MNRRGFIKLSGAGLLLATIVGFDRAAFLDPHYPPVVVSLEELEGSLEFWNHFGGNSSDPDSGIPKRLVEIRNEMRIVGISPQNQYHFKIELIKQIALDESSLFADELFSSIKNECKKLIS